MNIILDTNNGWKLLNAQRIGVFFSLFISSRLFFFFAVFIFCIVYEFWVYAVCVRLYVGVNCEWIARSALNSPALQ